MCDVNGFVRGCVGWMEAGTFVVKQRAECVAVGSSGVSKGSEMRQRVVPCNVLPHREDVCGGVGEPEQFRR